MESRMETITPDPKYTFSRSGYQMVVVHTWEAMAA